MHQVRVERHANRRRATKVCATGLLIWVSVIGSAGCMGSDKSTGEWQNTTSVTTGSGGTETNSGADTGLSAPRYWTLDGDLVIVNGALDLKQSQLALGMRRNSSEVCVDYVAIESVTDLGQPPSDLLLTWWELSWDNTKLVCFGEGEGGQVSPVRLGIGSMHPEIEAVLSSVDDVQSDQAGSSLNGAYVQLDGDERLLVYGVAGPSAALAGIGTPADDVPLSDGSWLLRTAYSLPLSW